jgi:energy-coupling factor transport system ATP-binding protein
VSTPASIRQVAADGAVVLLISHDEDLLALAADRHLILAPPSQRRHHIEISAADADQAWMETP